MKIVVIGGTGLIGSKVVQKLKQKGHEAIAAAPSTGVDTFTGEGVKEAFAGAQVVVDVSNSPSLEEKAALEFFETAGRNLVAAEIDAGVQHHVALSVVGTERLQDSGYFRAKLAQEKLIKSSPIPYSLVHATQFFEFVRAIADSSTQDGVVRVPPVKFQPMAAEDVAGAIADVAVSKPINSMIEVAGPDVFTLDQPVRTILEHDHDKREIVVDPQAPYFGIAVSEAALVPSGRPRLGSIKFDWWLTHAPPPPLRR